MKKSFKIAIVVVAVLVIIHLLLPSFVENYVNKVLGDLEGHQGHIADVEISLVRVG